MWQYFHNKSWIECKLLHEFLDKYQILYYDKLKNKWIEKVVSIDLIRKKEK